VYIGVLFEILIPTVGHTYSGNWKRGLLFKGAQISAFTLSFITSNIAWKNSVCPNGYEKINSGECYDENNGGWADVEPTGLNIVSMVLMASVPVLVIWEYVDVVKSSAKSPHHSALIYNPHIKGLISHLRINLIKLLD